MIHSINHESFCPILIVRIFSELAIKLKKADKPTVSIHVGLLDKRNLLTSWYQMKGFPLDPPKLHGGTAWRSRRGLTHILASDGKLKNSILGLG